VRAGDFDFLLVGAHIRWGSGETARELELRKLASWVADREKEKFIFDKDLILLGDFNIPSTKSALYATITEFGLKAPKATLGIGHGSNLAKDKRYDQILVAPHFPDSFTGKGGVLDVFDGGWRPLYKGISTKTEEELTFQMSDHLPLWIEINTDDDAFRLEQIVNPKG
jgi:endonuclease/exonuclease/phosphatase family metal-dependent hydrolase